MDNKTTVRAEFGYHVAPTEPMPPEMRNQPKSPGMGFLVAVCVAAVALLSIIGWMVAQG